MDFPVAAWVEQVNSIYKRDVKSSHKCPTFSVWIAHISHNSYVLVN